MALYFCIALAVMGLFILVSMVTLYIEISIKIENGRSRSFVVIRTLGGLVHKKVAFAMKPKAAHPFFLNMREPFAQEEAAISLQEIVSLLKEGLKALQQNARYFKRIKDKVNVEDFEVTLRLGTGDAAHTALLCGSLISLLYMVVAYLQNRYSLKGKRVDVMPVFDREDFELHLSCIIAVKLRDIIIAEMQKTAEKLKGGEKIVRASN